MFSSSIVCAVGSIDSVSSSASFVYWSRMWFSCPSRRLSSASVRPRRARWATCSTSPRDRLDMRPMIAHQPAPDRSASGLVRSTDPIHSAEGRPMTDETAVILKRFEAPDEVREMTLGRFEIISLGGRTIGRATYQPGWKWSEHVGPGLAQDRCPVEHVGL